MLCTEQRESQIQQRWPLPSSRTHPPYPPKRPTCLLTYYGACRTKYTTLTLLSLPPLPRPLRRLNTPILPLHLPSALAVR